MHKSKIQQTIVRLREKRNPPISEEEALQKARDNFMKALTECLILARLSKGDSYGYEISQSIKAYSGGCFRIPEGAMYPTLYRMLDRGYITTYTSDCGKRQMRIYYQITSAGRGHLEALMKAIMRPMQLSVRPLCNDLKKRLSKRIHMSASEHSSPLRGWAF